MIDEVAEFQSYTGVVDYSARNKQDTTYLGRFTYPMLMDFEGLARVFSILARGYMFGESTEPDDSKKASPKEDWQFRTSFSDYHDEFPELVDTTGLGWFCRHVRNVCAFVEANPEGTSKAAQKKCLSLRNGFEDAWRRKVVQFQVPLFSESAKYSWVLHFEDALSDALELGPLRQPSILLPSELLQRIEELTPKGVPVEVLQTMVIYYLVNKPEDSDWVVLPVVNFDAYFGTSSFGRKWLVALPKDFIRREKSSFGICRYKIGF